MGVAAVTALPGVGKLVTHAFPGTGAVATQARVNPYLGIDGIAHLRAGLEARDVLDRLRAQDPRDALRQFAVVDAAGNAVAWTGSECLDWAGSKTASGYAIQGNRLVGPEVLAAASEAFEKAHDEPLEVRFLAALEAGVAVGGDAKGERSATVYIVDTEEYPLWDIRVDEHANPIEELKRLHLLFAAQLVPHIRRMPTRANPAGEDDDEDA